MTIIRWACALALALLSPLATAQTGSSVQFPAGWAPGQSPCVKQGDGTCVPVSASNPLPVSSASAGTGATADQIQGNAASGAADTGNPVKTGGKYNASPPTLADGQRGDMQLDSNGRLLTLATTAGSVAAGTVDSGNPVKIGGVGSLTPLTAVATGYRQNLWLGVNGQMPIAGNRIGGSDAMSNSNIIYPWATNLDNVYGLFGVASSYFNGTSWDRVAGNTTGAFVIPKGGATIATSQVSVGTSATLLAAARTGRQKIGVAVTTAVQCAFGPAGVTLSTGWPLAATAYTSDTFDTAAALYGVCASTATVGVREMY